MKKLLFWGACLPAFAGNLPLPGAGRVAMEFNRSAISSVVVVGLAGPANAAIATDAVSGAVLRGCPLPAAAAALLQAAPFPAGVVPLFSTAGAQAGCRVVLDANGGTAGIQEFGAGVSLTLVYCSMSSAGAGSCDLGTSIGSPALYVEAGAARFPAQYPNQILKWQLDDRTNAGDAVGDNNDLVLTVREAVSGSLPLDEDGDGLWDDWETEGADVDADGFIDVNLPAPGAQKRRRNVFVYVDYMDCAAAGGDCSASADHNHRPKAAAITRVVQAYAGAVATYLYQPSPGITAAGLVTNADGTHGVILTVEVAPAGVVHQNVMSLGACGSAAAGAADFDAQKAASFGSNPKRFTHRYAIFGHGQASTGGPTGCGETPGNDFLITLGNISGPAGDLDGDGTTDDGKAGTVLQQAGTFMHELGHTLGLRHGGGDLHNYKPNYISVMNYSFQLGGIPQSLGQPAVVDYSGAVGITLTENSDTELLEGISPIYSPTLTTLWRTLNPGRTDLARITCPNFASRMVPVLGGVADFDCSGAVDFAHVNVPDLNGDRECVRPGADGVRQTPVSGDDVLYIGQFIHDGPDRTCASGAVGDDVQVRPVGGVQPSSLNGYSDWANLRFDYYSITGYQDGDHGDTPAPPELDVATYVTRLAPDPGITITAAPSGAGIAFTVTTANNSTPPANSVQTTVTVPAALSIGSCAATAGGVCSGSGTTRQIVVEPLAGGQTSDATVVATGACTSANPPMQTVNATVTSATPDSDGTNNAASISYPTCVAGALPAAVTYGAPRRSPVTGLYAQPVTIRNTAAQAATGPFSVALNNLTPGVTLVGPSGATAYAAPAGRPYRNLGISSLAAGASTTVNLSFQNPANVSYGFTVQLLGPGAR